MSGRPDVRGALGILLALTGGCARPEPAPLPAQAPLPALPAADLRPPTPIVLPPSDPAALPPGPPVTLTSADVDLRVLLVALAEAAGLSLIVGPEVRGRVSVNLVDVPARDALREILASAGLDLAAGPPRAPLAPVIFYAVPVDIDEASAELIVARFGVSREAAEWIVRHRID